MDKAKVKTTGFYDRYGSKKVAFLEKGQDVEIVEHYGDKHLCSVINPTEDCKNYGGFDGMLAYVYKEHLSPEPNKPEQGKQYRLTGGNGVPSIANGNSWAESEVTDE